jgi:hypothetical protein
MNGVWFDFAEEEFTRNFQRDVKPDRASRVTRVATRAVYATGTDLTPTWVWVVVRVSSAVAEITWTGTENHMATASVAVVHRVDPTALARCATVVADASAEVHLPTAFQAGISGGSIARTSCALRLLVKPSRVAAPADLVDGLAFTSANRTGPAGKDLVSSAYAAIVE